MSDRERRAIARGALGAWLACITAAIAVRLAGHLAAAQVLGAASLPWLFLALWADRKARSG